MITYSAELWTSWIQSASCVYLQQYDLKILRNILKKSPVENTAAIINNVPDKTCQRDQKYFHAFMLSHWQKQILIIAKSQEHMSYSLVLIIPVCSNRMATFLSICDFQKG